MSSNNNNNKVKRWRRLLRIQELNDLQQETHQLMMHQQSSVLEPVETLAILNDIAQRADEAARNVSFEDTDYLMEANLLKMCFDVMDQVVQSNNEAIMPSGSSRESADPKEKASKSDSEGCKRAAAEEEPAAEQEEHPAKKERFEKDNGNQDSPTKTGKVFKPETEPEVAAADAPVKLTVFWEKPASSPVRKPAFEEVWIVEG